MSDSETLYHRLAWRVAERLPPADRGRAVLVTSARPGEGKTKISNALAAALAEQTGAAVCLVSCSPGTAAGDPGNASLCALLEAPSLEPAAARGRALRVTHFEFGHGPVSVLFKLTAMARVLDHLRGRFGFVVLDGRDLADCGVLAAASDGTLLVINAERTRREIVRGTLKANPIPPGKLLGAVLNETPRYVPRWLYRRAL